jgi:two-component system, chemotaxis family, protein-glutamate methylesterase/glutaminase
MPSLNNIIVIGASAGGFPLVKELVSKIDRSIPAALFVVIHISRSSQSEIIAQHLQKSSALNCSVALHGEEIKPGHLYVPPVNQHIIVTEGIIKLSNGPYENRWRPSIDVLFRTAAAAYNSKVIGIVLSGLLDDGTSGMYAVKQCGGICIVQEPHEAEFPDMPVNVMNKVDVDYRVPLNDIPYILADITAKESKKPGPVPEEIRIEAKINENMSSNMDDMEKLGEQTPFTCPDCGGSLWTVKEGVNHRYRCYTGHAYNERTLLQKQFESLEESLWLSVRLLEERRNLLMVEAGHATPRGEDPTGADSVKELEIHIERLKSVLAAMNKPSIN